MAYLNGNALLELSSLMIILSFSGNCCSFSREKKGICTWGNEYLYHWYY